MTKAPELIDFVGGFRGPVGEPHRGAVLRIIAALVYRDGVVIEWLLQPTPDLSDVPIDEKRIRDMGKNFRNGMPATYLADMREIRKVSELMARVTLADDQGTPYGKGLGSTASIGAGYKGRLMFRPGPPDNVERFIVSLDQTRIVIPTSSEDS